MRKANTNKNSGFQSFLVKITNLFDKQDQSYCPRLNIKIDEMPYILNVKK